MRKVVFILTLALLIVIGAQLWDFNTRREDAAAKLSSLAAELRSIEEENRALQADISYYANPANLEKELRARFNYKLPGEKLIIVVPKRQ